MAVQLPSDIVADVMRNADPVRRLAAARKLESTGGPAAPQFASLAGLDLPISAAVPDVRTVDDTSGKGVDGQSRSSDVYRDFEQVVLRNLFEVMLPTEESGAFGGGPSAGVWRSMAAEEMAGVVADGAGIGIGKMLSTSSDDVGLRRESQWPYFSRDSLEPFKA